MPRAKRPTLSDSLAELVGEATISAALAPANERVTDLTLDSLEPNPFQPRRQFDLDVLEQLAVSIHTHGILQPLLVRPVGHGRYQIVSGERRWRASQLLANPDSPLVVDGQTLQWDREAQRVPVVIRDVPDENMRVLAAVENLQRADLNMIDEVDATVSLIAAALDISEEDVPATLSRLVRHPDEQQVLQLEGLFHQLGRGTWQSFLKNKMRVRRLPEDVLSAMRSHGLDYRKATLIGACDDSRQREMLLTLSVNGASLEQLRAAIRAQDASRPPLTPDAAELSRTVGRRLTSLSAVTALNAQRRKRLEALLTQMNLLFEEQEREGQARKGPVKRTKA